MIKHFSANHEVTVASLARSADEAREAQGIAPYCADFAIASVRNPIQVARMVARLPTTTPSSMGYFYSPELARRIHAFLAAKEFDLIFAHCSSVAQYVAGVTGIPKILDFGDMDSQKWLEYANYKPFPLSFGYRLEGKKMEREEKRLARMFNMCTATTRAEWRTLQEFGVTTQSDWFPNGVDHQYFAPTLEPYDADTISFVGRMDYYPNQQCMFDFCAATLPLIREKRPNAKLLIVGADPTPAVRKLGELQGVTVTGSVPDVRPYVRSSAVMVAPLNIARGTQNKILESMAMGVPVVTSTAAAGGVDALDKEHFLVATSPQESATSILRLMNDKTERSRLSVAGRERMLTHHNWSESMKRLDAIVERCIDLSSKSEFSNRVSYEH